MRYYRDFAVHWFSLLYPWFVVGWAGVDAVLGDWRGTAAVCLATLTGIGTAHLFFWIWSRHQ